MAYITNADIERRLGSVVYVQLSDDAGTGVADENVVNEVRVAAEGEVDSYLGRRYAVPVDLVALPELAGVLKGIALDLAEYRLHGRRIPVPQGVIAKRDAAVRWLQQVADGEIVLPGTTEVATNPANGPAALAVGAPRVLTRAEMENL